MKSKCKNRITILLMLCLVLLTAAVQCIAEESALPSPEPAEIVELGEGAKSFAFEVLDLEGNSTHYLIHTDGETVGEALLNLELIEGEEGPYGLYVLSVNGIPLRYETDGHYWAFYINDEYAMSGVDMTPITEGECYAFHAE